MYSDLDVTAFYLAGCISGFCFCLAWLNWRMRPKRVKRDAPTGTEPWMRFDRFPEDREFWGKR